MHGNNATVAVRDHNNLTLQSEVFLLAQSNVYLGGLRRQNQCSPDSLAVLLRGLASFDGFIVNVVEVGVHHTNPPVLLSGFPEILNSQNHLVSLSEQPEKRKDTSMI